MMQLYTLYGLVLTLVVPLASSACSSTQYQSALVEICSAGGSTFQTFLQFTEAELLYNPKLVLIPKGVSFNLNVFSGSNDSVSLWDDTTETCLLGPDPGCSALFSAGDHTNNVFDLTLADGTQWIYKSESPDGAVLRHSAVNPQPKAGPDLSVRLNSTAGGLTLTSMFFQLDAVCSGCSACSNYMNCPAGQEPKCDGSLWVECQTTTVTVTQTTSTSFTSTLSTSTVTTVSTSTTITSTVSTHTTLTTTSRTHTTTSSTTASTTTLTQTSTTSSTVTTSRTASTSTSASASTSTTSSSSSSSSISSSSTSSSTSSNSASGGTATATATAATTTTATATATATATSSSIATVTAADASSTATSTATATATTTFTATATAMAIEASTSTATATATATAERTNANASSVTFTSTTTAPDILNVSLTASSTTPFTVTSTTTAAANTSQAGSGNVSVNATVTTSTALPASTTSNLGAFGLNTTTTTTTSTTMTIAGGGSSSSSSSTTTTTSSTALPLSTTTGLASCSPGEHLAAGGCSGACAPKCEPCGWYSGCAELENPICNGSSVVLCDPAVILLEALTSTYAGAGTVGTAFVAVEVNSTWTPKAQFFDSAAEGEVVNVSLTVSKWPTAVNVSLDSDDAWGVQWMRLTLGTRTQYLWKAPPAASSSPVTGGTGEPSLRWLGNESTSLGGVGGGGPGSRIALGDQAVGVLAVPQDLFLHLEIWSSMQAHAETASPVRYSLETAGQWSEKKTLLVSAAAGEVIAASIAASHFPSRLRLFAEGGDEWGYSSIRMTLRGEERWLLQSDNGEPMNTSNTTLFWLGSKPEVPSVQTYGVPGSDTSQEAHCRGSEFQSTALVLSCTGGEGIANITFTGDENVSLAVFPAGASNVSLELSSYAAVELLLFDEQSGDCIVGPGCMYSLACENQSDYCIEHLGLQIYFTGSGLANQSLEVSGQLLHDLSVQLAPSMGPGQVMPEEVVITFAYGPLATCPAPLPGCHTCSAYPGCGAPEVPQCNGGPNVLCQAPPTTSETLTATSTHTTQTSTATFTQTSQTSTATFTQTSQTTTTTTTSTQPHQDFTSNATADDGSLGLGLTGTPPNRVHCSSVEPGSWADRSGILVGDELLAINGRAVSSMTPEDLPLLLATRPLSMVWRREGVVPSDLFAANASASDTSLGVIFGGMPPGRVHAVAVEPDSWATRKGITPGDELLSINGRNISGMTPVEFAQLWSAVRPLATEWRRGNVVPGNVFMATAAQDDASLGVTFSGVPPGPVRSATVVPNSWADRSGVTPGDELLALNGQNISGLTPEEFSIMLSSTRPLSMAWRRDDPVPANHITATATASDTDLGLTFTGEPPSQVWSATVDPDSWADRSGISPGDELLSLDGRNISDLTLSDFAALLSSRPLRMVWRQTSQVVPNVHYARTAVPNENSLGVIFSSGPPDIMRALTIVPGSWADRSGVLPGDALVSLNGQNVASMAPDLFDRIWTTTRPLTTVWRRGLAYGDTYMTTGNWVNLGFSLLGNPPGQVWCSDVEQGSWAAKSGILVGDELLAANGRTMSSFTAAQFGDLVSQTRPLHLVWRRGSSAASPPTTTSTPTTMINSTAKDPWVVSEWGTCHPTSCGQGIRSRLVRCSGLCNASQPSPVWQEVCEDSSICYVSPFCFFPETGLLTCELQHYLFIGIILLLMLCCCSLLIFFLCFRLQRNSRSRSLVTQRPPVSEAGAPPRPSAEACEDTSPFPSPEKTPEKPISSGLTESDLKDVKKTLDVGAVEIIHCIGEPPGHFEVVTVSPKGERVHEDWRSNMPSKLPPLPDGLSRVPQRSDLWEIPTEAALQATVPSTGHNSAASSLYEPRRSGAQDPKWDHAMRVVDRTTRELSRVMADVRAAPRRHKPELFAKMRRIETDPEYLQAKRYLEEDRQDSRLGLNLCCGSNPDQGHLNMLSPRTPLSPLQAVCSDGSVCSDASFFFSGEDAERGERPRHDYAAMAL